MNRLKSGELDLHALDAAQLIKHALALSTDCSKSGRSPVLYYVFADPIAWPEGHPVDVSKRKQHAELHCILKQATNPLAAQSTKLHQSAKTGSCKLRINRGADGNTVLVHHFGTGTQ